MDHIISREAVRAVLTQDPIVMRESFSREPWTDRSAARCIDERRKRFFRVHSKRETAARFDMAL